MRKLLKLSLIAASLAASTSVLASTALTCRQMIGYWHGNLSHGMAHVALNIGSVVKSPYENATISFTQNDAGIDIGGLVGDCKTNADGSVTMQLNGNGFAAATLKMQLITPSQLRIKSFNYQAYGEYGSASGILTK